MKIRHVAQPDITLGILIESLLSRQPPPNKVTIVSAFVSLTTILRLEEKLRAISIQGSVKLVVGVDLGGTSKEVLERILGWSCDAFVIHHSNPRHTFHPKIFLFEYQDEAHLIVGSNNLTDGGLFSNFEAFTHTTFTLPVDRNDYDSALVELESFLEPRNPAALELSTQLIKTLVDRGELPTEKQGRKNRSPSKQPRNKAGVESPFPDGDLPSAPGLPDSAREALSEISVDLPERAHPVVDDKDHGLLIPDTEVAQDVDPELVWESKPLTARSLNIPEGKQTNITGDTNLGKGSMSKIDFQHYFRDTVFSGLQWSTDDSSNSPYLERAQIRAEIVLNGVLQGMFDLEVTHDPRTDTKSYKQKNAMTKIKWGEARSIIANRDYLGLKMRLYKKDSTNFVIDIAE